MTISIISIGTKPNPETTTLINLYTSRLPKTIILDWTYIKHGPGDAKTSMRKEAESILRNISKNNKIIVLVESGKQMSSPQLTNVLFSDNQDVTFIIGGAYGVDNSIIDIADSLWSLGNLVFPHQLVRLILAEQIYRAHTISIGHPYHHE